MTRRNRYSYDAPLTLQTKMAILDVIQVNSNLTNQINVFPSIFLTSLSIPFMKALLDLLLSTPSQSDETQLDVRALDGAMLDTGAQVQNKLAVMQDQVTRNINAKLSEVDKWFDERAPFDELDDMLGINELKVQFGGDKHASTEAFLTDVMKHKGENAVIIQNGLRESLFKSMNELCQHIEQQGLLGGQDLFNCPESSSGLTILQIYQYVQNNTKNFFNLMKATVQLKMAYELMGEATNQIGSELALDISSLLAKKLGLASQYVLNPYFVPELLGYLAIHFVIVKPIVRRYYERNMLIANHPLHQLEKGLYLMTEREGRDILDALEEKMQDLKGRAASHRKWSKVMMSMLFACYLILPETEFSPYILASFFSLLTLVFANVFQEKREARIEKQFHKQKALMRENLKSFSNVFGVKCNFHSFNDSQDGVVELSFTDRKIQSKTGLKPSALRKLISGVFLRNKIKIIARYNTAIQVMLSDMARFSDKQYLSLIQAEVQDAIKDFIAQKDSPTKSTQGKDSDNLSLEEIWSKLREEDAPPEKYHLKKSDSNQNMNLNIKMHTIEQKIKAEKIRFRIDMPGKEYVYYDPKDPKCEVHPVINGNGKHFTICLFSHTANPGVQKLKEVIERDPKFVPAKGSQGLKSSDEMVQTADGRIARSRCKAKLMGVGALGSLRAIGYPVKGERADEKNLHVFLDENIIYKHR